MGAKVRTELSLAPLFHFVDISLTVSLSLSLPASIILEFSNPFSLSPFLSLPLSSSLFLSAVLTNTLRKLLTAVALLIIKLEM
jgi:hypothetical protein